MRLAGFWHVTQMAPSEMTTEVRLTDAEFERVAVLAKQLAGLELQDHKRQLVNARLSRRLADLQISTYDAYLSILEKDPRHKEITDFCNALTTNLTSFFREPHHFRHLETNLSKNPPQDRLRIWSAACSSGEEPYSIAMSLLEHPKVKSCPDVKILATDLDTKILNRARRGHYTEERLASMEPKLRDAYFSKTHGGEFAVKPACRQMVVFNFLNLLGEWPMQVRFDYIFCRNVMIYFDTATQNALVNRLIARLQPGGVLYIGHSETAIGRHPLLECEGHTIYRSRQ